MKLYKLNGFAEHRPLADRGQKAAAPAKAGRWALITMKQNKLKVLKSVGIFLSGAIIGGIILNLLNIYVRPTYREAIRIDFLMEQDFLANRAVRDGDKISAVVHRWNVVNAEAKDGFKSFSKERNRDFDSSFFFPFQMLALSAIMNSDNDAQEKGARIAEGMDRGRLALSLESIGAQKEADKQWEYSRSMIGKKSIDETRAIILKTQGVYNSDEYRQAEKVFLKK